MSKRMQIKCSCGETFTATREISEHVYINTLAPPEHANHAIPADIQEQIDAALEGKWALK